MNRWTEDSGGTKGEKLVKVGPAKTVPFARSLYPGTVKLSTGGLDGKNYEKIPA